MDDFTCNEILEELLVRFQKTNGIEFCNRETLAKVMGILIQYENEQNNCFTDDELFT